MHRGLARNEDDQLFLSDAANQMRSEQAAIAAKVGKVQPLKKGAIVVVGLTSLCVLGYYVLDIVKQFSY